MITQQLRHMLLKDINSPAPLGDYYIWLEAACVPHLTGHADSSAA
jgi:hypothetical protein